MAAVRVVALLALVASVLSCAVPPEGCKKSVCDSYSNVSPTTVASGANYTDPATWKKYPGLPKIGFYLGVYNKLVNGGVYPGKGAGWKSAKGTPALNYEKFKLEPQFFVKGVPNPVKTHLPGCCNTCRVTPGCALYQYIYASQTCYLLTGGSESGDGPEGAPFSGSKSQQAADKTTVPSFVGGRCNPGSEVVDDPHFTGAHGTHFDFNGELDKSFCLVTDRRVHINALLKGYKDTRTTGATVGKDGKALRSWIRELGLLWVDAQGNKHDLHLVARNGKQQERGDGFLAAAVLDGYPLAIPAEAGASVQNGELTVTFLGISKTGPYDVERFQVTVGEQLDMGLSLRVAHPLLQTPDNAEVHFNLMLNDLRASDKVHGVLGQTYRETANQQLKAVKYSELSRLLGAPVKADGESGRGFLDGAVKDYESSSILRADCKVSTFSA